MELYQVKITSSFVGANAWWSKNRKSLLLYIQKKIFLINIVTEINLP
jgi:hypothetical protein